MQMSAIGVRFGKGLQLTNIVKDIARDLHHGRCYVPEPLLREVGLTTADLLDPDSLPRFRPVLMRLIRMAMEHLDQGWMYTMAIPRLEIRQRLACMWPILLAGKRSNVWPLRPISSTRRLMSKCRARSSIV